MFVQLFVEKLLTLVCSGTQVFLCEHVPTEDQCSVVCA